MWHWRSSPTFLTGSALGSVPYGASHVWSWDLPLSTVAELVTAAAYLALVVVVAALIGLILSRDRVVRLLRARTERDRLLATEQAAMAVLRAALGVQAGDLSQLVAAIAEQRDAAASLNRTLTTTVAQFRTLARNFPGGVALFDTDLVYVLSDGTAARALGAGQRALEGTPLGGLLIEAAELIRAYARACLAGKPQQYTYVHGGQTFEVSMLPLREHDGGPITGGLIITTDRTEQLRAEARLRESDARYRLLAEYATDMISRHTMDGSCIWVSPSAEMLLGYTPEAIVGTTIVDSIEPDDLPLLREHFAAVAEGGTHVPTVYRMRHRDGSVVWVESIARVIALDDGTREIHIFSRDVTERLRAEARLRKSDARYRLIAEHASDMISRHSMDRTYLWVSPSAETLLGYTPDELIGTSPYDLIHEDDLQVVRHSTTSMGENDVPQPNAYRMRRKNGTSVWVETVARIVRMGDGSQEIHAATRDISVRRRLEEQFLQAQKMESVGRLAGGVAHDFNNLLTTILGTIELAMLDETLVSQTRTDLETVYSAAQRATSLTRQLLSFARQQIIELHTIDIDLNQLVLGIGAMMRRIISAAIELTIVPAPEPALVRADAAQIEQVVINLLINARDAMPLGGRLTIKISVEHLDERYLQAQPSHVPGPHICLSMTDTGVGMPPAVRNRIFEPFFTTKEKGKGTGLGLSSVYGIVQQHRGLTWVYSEVGVGTTFRVFLPMTVNVGEPARPAPPTEMPTGSEHILLAEDDANVRSYVIRVLGALGYTVVAAEDGAVALAVAAQHAETPFDLLLTDVIMPRVGGQDLAAEIGRRFPQTKVLFMSGYADNHISVDGAIMPGTMFIQKPFASAALAQKVRQVLDA